MRVVEQYERVVYEKDEWRGSSYRMINEQRYQEQYQVHVQDTQYRERKRSPSVQCAHIYSEQSAGPTVQCMIYGKC